jgi:RNA polymerase subunit RPABC4/transcription elongation factor Spt4
MSEQRCKKCGEIFRSDLTICPRCGNRQIFEIKEYEEKICPKCNTTLRRGFMVERNTPLSVVTIGEGIYWSPSEAGVISRRVAVVAYACPDCGYIEHYIRRLHLDRDLILKAPK